MSQAIGSTAASFHRVWHHINLKDAILGRTATRIAILLMGKHKPIYDPALDCGDYVVVSNCRQVQVTGKKATQKLYRKHTGWKLKETPFDQMMAKNPEFIIKNAVSGMLPKNKLRQRRLERLKIFQDDQLPPAYAQNIMKRYDMLPVLKSSQPIVES